MDELIKKDCRRELKNQEIEEEEIEVEEFKDRKD